MRIKVYQLDMDKDTNRVKFSGLAETMKIGGKVDPKAYTEVFNGEVDCADAEEVYMLFNTDPPPLHRGHSLSVSDIIQTDEGCFFCNPVGFETIDFDTTQTTKPADFLRVVAIEPGKAAYEAEIQDDLRSWQRAVGGLMEVTYPFKDNAVVVSNEEGKLIGLPGNRTIGNELYAGTMYIVGDDGGGNFMSLTDEQISSHLKQFAEPEQYTDEDVENSIHIDFQTF